MTRNSLEVLSVEICSRNELGGRLSDEDDELVQTVLAYHPKLSEKAGCGTAYIKVVKLLLFNSYQALKFCSNF